MFFLRVSQRLIALNETDNTDNTPLIKVLVVFQKVLKKFHWILLGFTWSLLGFPGVYRVLTGFAGFYWVFMDFKFFWVLPSFKLVFLGLNWFY